MKKIKLLFSKELYDDKAVYNAAETFGNFAKIKVSDEDGNYCVSISTPGGEEEEMIVGEIMNFILARTVELRAK